MIPEAPFHWRAALAVLHKEIRVEWRTRSGLSAALLFTVAAPVALSFSLIRQRPEPATLGGLLWVVLLFAALIGLMRTFLHEEESGTARLLRLHAAPDAVFAGKALFSLGLLLVTQLVAVPLFLILFHGRIALPWLLVAGLVLGDLGLAAGATLLGAIASRGRARGALFVALSLPVMLPLLVLATAVTAAALGATGGISEAKPPLQMLALYDILLVVSAWLLFPGAWRA